MPCGDDPTEPHKAKLEEKADEAAVQAMQADAALAALKEELTAEQRRLSTAFEEHAAQHKEMVSDISQKLEYLMQRAGPSEDTSPKAIVEPSPRQVQQHTKAMYIEKGECQSVASVAEADGSDEEREARVRTAQVRSRALIEKGRAERAAC